jgi:hypothetical protein
MILIQFTGPIMDRIDNVMSFRDGNKLVSLNKMETELQICYKQEGPGFDSG